MGDLFCTVTKAKLSPMFATDAGEIRYKEIMEFLNLSRDDIAKATNISLESIRYDRKVRNAELRGFFLSVINIIGFALEHYDNLERVQTWFRVTNPLLGNRQPIEVVKAGEQGTILKLLITEKERSHESGIKEVAGNEWP